MAPARRLTIVDGGDAEQLLAAVASRTDLVTGPRRRRRRVRVDTFDWRLHRAGTVLDVDDGPEGLELRWTALDGSVIGRAALAGMPRFGWDLPDGPVTDRLRDLLEVRALLPLAEAELTSVEHRLVDDEGKAVARLVVEAPAVGRSPRAAGARTGPTTLTVVPVRGYEAEADGLARLLEAQVLLVPAQGDLLDERVRAAGLVPGSYSPKLRLALPADAAAAAAWWTVLAALFDTQLANEAGLRDDVDAEFLHDFRVAIRRTRSVLGQAGGVLPPGVVERFRADFAWLGSATGPARDLDVYVLGLPTMADALPPGRRGDLKPFGALLERRQAEAHQRLVSDLDSPRYAALVRDWRTAVGGRPEVDDDGRPGPRADEPATVVAGARIWRAHRRLVRDGRAIDEASAPEALHDLRKDAKKLRYLLECFGSLWPPEVVDPVVRPLKALQEVLGDYQDSQVQITSIDGFAQDLVDDGDAPAPTLLAMGGVVEHLRRAESAARAGFAARFAAYDRRELRDHLRQVFRPTGDTP